MIGIVIGAAARLTSPVDGRDTAASGGVAKTLAAPIPAVMAPATTAVTYPLVALMARTVIDDDVLERINSGMRGAGFDLYG